MARKVVKRKTKRRVKKSAKVKERKEFYDLEDLLVNNLLSSSHKSNNTISDLIYSSTDSLANLGYRFGILIGKSLHRNSEGRNALPDVLEKFGFGKIFYQPFKEELIITSSKRSTLFDVGRNVHIFESGLISGYLSDATASSIFVHESRCIYNNSNICQFIAMHLKENRYNLEGYEIATEALAKAFLASKHSETQSEYHLIASIPFTKEPLLEEVSKLLYMSGKRLGALDSNTKEDISRIANSFNIERCETESYKNKRVIKLKYGHHNSTDEFIRLSTAPIFGLVSEEYTDISLDKRLNKDRSYTVTIEAKR